MQTVRISVDGVELTAELNETETAQAIAEALPIQGRANVWGDEIYFGIPVHLDEAEDAHDIVEIGDLAYWPPGNAFCIFYGRTPVSTDDRPRAASPVNVFGQVIGDATEFVKVRDGASITIEAI